MKLILTILLLATTIFASNIDKIKHKVMRDTYIGSNHMLPQVGLVPKKEKTYLFTISSKDVIFDKKNKKAWYIPYKYPSNLARMKDSMNFCSPHVDPGVTPELIKTLDLNLLEFILKQRQSAKGKDISIFVKVKNGRNNNPRNYKVFSITQNKYLESNTLNTPYKSYHMCTMDYDSAIKLYNKLYEMNKQAEKQEQEEAKQKKINIQKRKTIQIADDTDQGMILEIKGPLVLVQTKVCTARNGYGSCVGSGYASKWVRKKELTFKNQKD